MGFTLETAKKLSAAFALALALGMSAPAALSANPNTQGALPRSAITLPNRVLTRAEMNAWRNEYDSLGGPNAFELEVVRLVNIERAARNLPPLSIDPILMKAARFKSQSMSDLNYMAHDGVYGNPTALARTFGFDGGVGENLYRGPLTPERAVQGWMDSPGHRANILNRQYGAIGVGVHVNGNGWISWTQMFSGTLFGWVDSATRERRAAEAAAGRERAAREAAAGREREAARREIAAANERARLAREARRTSATRNAWELLSVSYLWEEGAVSRTGIGFAVPFPPSGVYASPFTFTAVGFEARAAFFGETMRDLEFGFASVAPSLGLVLPLGGAGRVFANGMVEAGLELANGPRGPGLIANWAYGSVALWATPGFDVGLEFGRRWTFNVKYRRVWFRDGHVNSIGVGFGSRRR